MADRAVAAEKAAVLPGEATSARAARRFIADALNGWSLHELREAAELLTCELVTNVVLHVRGELTLRVRRLPDGVRVEVVDSSPAALPHPARSRGGDDRSTGRGLVLVDALAADWGVVPTTAGKCVWFEVARDAA